MRHFALAFTFGLALLPAGATSAAAADPEHPTVIELFQSQGCSSCPPANANLNALTGRPELLPLSFAVTYWDRLGWKDTFAAPAFTARQHDYANAGHRSQVYTPQMIVNGRGVLVGNNRSELERAIRRFDRGTSGPAIERNGERVTVGPAPNRHPATVWLVTYDPQLRNVPIKAGENGGKTLPHRNIVRSLERLGSWGGTAVTLRMPATGNPAYRTAVLVQEGVGGPIVAARRI
jgi:hypothetical protein